MLRYHPGIFLEVLRKATKNLSQHSQSPNEAHREVTPVPAE